MPPPVSQVRHGVGAGAGSRLRIRRRVRDAAPYEMGARGPRRSPAQHPQGVRRIRKAAKRTIWSLRRRCHAAGWAHGRVAKSGLREKCRSGLCPSPVFSPAPCLSSPMRLPSALLAVTLRLFATPGFPPAPGTNSQFANWPGLYPSLRSIRAAHGGSALLFRQFPQKFFRNLLKRAKRTGIIERQCM